MDSSVRLPRPPHPGLPAQAVVQRALRATHPRPILPDLCGQLLQRRRCHLSRESSAGHQPPGPLLPCSLSAGMVADSSPQFGGNEKA